MGCEDCCNYQPMSAEEGYCDRKGKVVSWNDGCGLVYEDDLEDENDDMDDYFELRNTSQRDFINYDSKIFLRTIELMKKYKLYSFFYQDWVDESEYDEKIYYGTALDICNRLYGYTCGYEQEDFIKIVEDIFDFWDGNITKEDNGMKEKIKNFTNELVEEYRKTR